MKVYLEAVGTAPPWHDQLMLLRDLASKDDLGRHCLVSDRASADIVLAVFHEDPRFYNLVYNLEHDDRRFVFCTYDNGFPALPGLYPSLTPWNADLRFARSAPYLPKPWDDEDVQLNRNDRTYLFSFVGSVLTSAIRRRVLELRHPRGLIRDSSNDDAYRSAQPQEIYRRFHQSYRVILADSAFVLCPRGVGASSIRLFETMRAGRVPVVISDQWMPPSGIPWDEFIVRIREKELETIPEHLESLEGRARDMGRLARQQWELNFSESRIFNWMVEQIAEMGRVDYRAFQRWKARKLLAWRNLRRVTLPILKRRALRSAARNQKEVGR
jgi:hypothetical protein